jgi:single-stranded-DNA-specific exonuclease
MKELTTKQIKSKLEQRFLDDEFLTLKDMPRPDSFKDIHKASQRIIQALKNDETINIVGDYDADGVNSTAIMIEFFNKAIGVEVNHIIPNRFDHGYGINEAILEFIYDGIIITVDNGISAVNAAKICKQRNLDLIITDHHTVGQILPDAFAVINPKQVDCLFPFKDICGAHVAWYLCAQLKQDLKLEFNLAELFDFLTIAIIADIMPMKSLNKTIVKKGLQRLATSRRPFLIALRERFGFSNIITEEDIGFKIAPLINCAGRMKDASFALEFLLSYDEYEANTHLDYLIELNEQRKKEQLNIFEDAKLQVNTEDEVIVVSSTIWNEGIIGIVASKLCDTYKKPAFVFKEKIDIAKASARSVANINLYDLITQVQNLTIGYGGHKGAAGLAIKNSNLNEFKVNINKAFKYVDAKDKVLESNAFCRLSLNLVNDELYNVINSFKPYGLENELPVFEFHDLNIVNITKIGKNKEYKKVIVSNGEINIDLLIFIDIEDLNINNKISFIASISKNEFRNNITYNLMFKELL